MKISIETELGLKYQWQGGEYVDVFRRGDEYPMDIINVWDYSTGKPSIVTFDDLRERVSWYEVELVEVGEL